MHRILSESKKLTSVHGRFIFLKTLKITIMKKFEIKSTGSLTNYIKDNTIKAKGEITAFVVDKEWKGNSCFGITLPERSVDVSLSL